MQSWIADICDVAHCLQDADAKASEEDVILVLTQGSPSTFDNFVVSLNATATSNLTINYIFSHLLNKEAHQGISGPPDVNLALAAASACCDLQNITCHSCHQKGHYQSHCPQHTTPTPPATATQSINVTITASDTFAF